jgi:hypothetical protein
MPAKRRTLVTCLPKNNPCGRGGPFFIAAAIELASVRGFSFFRPVQGRRYYNVA